MAGRYILAHDLGTTGDKATLYGTDGMVRASRFHGYATHHPHAGWAEQDPGAWWEAVRATTGGLLAGNGLAPRDVACVVFSGQMQGCLPVDRRGHPLRRCIIWADQRAVREAAELEQRLGLRDVYAITGHRPSPAYSGPKIRWLRRHEPEVYAGAHKFLHVKDYIVHRLTGRFVTDRSDASGMNLYDLASGDWSPPILRALEIDEALLPPIHASTDVVGEVTGRAAEELGLRRGTPVVLGGGDGASATVGAGSVRPGIAYNYVGASSWIAFTSERPIEDPAARIFTFAHMVPGRFIPMGTMQSAGAAYAWLRDRVCQTEVLEAARTGADAYDLMSAAAERSPPGARGLLFLPYLLGERSPHWNPRARGAWIGLTLRHEREDLIRSVLEGITLNLRLILEVFEEAGAAIREMRVIGGGAEAAVWRQLMADVYGLPVLSPRWLEEATSLGAAVCGGVGIGLFPGFDVVDELVAIVDRHDPDPGRRDVYARIHAVFRAAYEALRPAFDELHELDVLARPASGA